MGRRGLERANEVDEVDEVNEISAASGLTRSKWVDLKLVSRLELGSGAVAMRYEPSR
jgi:hypothetical protein